MKKLFWILAAAAVAAIGVLTPHISRAATVRTATEPWVTNKVAQAAADVLADAEDYTDTSVSNLEARVEAEIGANTHAIAENRIQIATNAADIVTLKTGKQDAISDLETIRSGAALGATALQSYTETDPTVPSWAKADTKPTYTLNDVAPNSENWLGVQGNAGRLIKILAQGSGSSPAGGVQVTASTLNNNNTTTYAYSGVAVKRSGTNTDYLWDTTSASGIVRRSELAPFITQHQSLTNYYTKSQADGRYLQSHQSLTNYYTKAEVDTAIAGAGGGGVKAVSVESGGTFGTGDLADGKVEMWRVSCAGAYTPSSSWHLIGYGAWPAAGSTWQCTVWRIGSAYYCNIIIVE